VTDEALVEKRLAFLETCLVELRTLARLDALSSDVRERRFVEHTLQLAIQAALDVASHVVADRRLGEPETRADLFRLLAGAGWLTDEQARRLGRMTGMRNVLVHGYVAVDGDLVRDALENHLGDLDELIAAVRAKLAGR
jgi:uncharacterized protein YutE (UPF0331/DUF86 family)